MDETGFEAPDFDDIAPGLPAPDAAGSEAEDLGEAARQRQRLVGLLDVPLTLSVVLGKAQPTVAQLLETRVGSVIELDRRVGEPVDVLVGDRLVASGELVVVDGVLGVTLTDLRAMPS